MDDKVAPDQTIVYSLENPEIVLLTHIAATVTAFVH